MYQSKSLDEIRKKIDSLDNQIHDLLLERADLIMAISNEKKKAGIQIVQPAREARMIRRLIARHRGPLPQETIVRIWRELVSSVSLLQTGLSVAVYTPYEIPEYWDMARDYFGTVLPMQRLSTPEAALNLVRDGKVTFAVLPFPEVSDHGAWWSLLFDVCDREEGVSIIQRLPFGDKVHYDYDRYPALVVAKAGFGTSDDDHSLIGIRSEDEISRSRLMEELEKAGIKVENLYGTARHHIADTHTYLTADDERLLALKKALEENGKARICLLGGYPSQPAYSNKTETLA
ncbi:MAG TPA: chorismate mutase [Alphaproteobacteria bacterium]|nr:chorismate mutase [Alphaproteobacteria bacterium]HNS45307.1 chorismate mutase [Alphaproteobacteria bacterium]